jgi:hypothetical protein
MANTEDIQDFSINTGGRKIDISRVAVATSKNMVIFISQDDN